MIFSNWSKIFPTTSARTSQLSVVDFLARNLRARSLGVVCLLFIYETIFERNVSLLINYHISVVGKSKNVFQIYKEKFIMAQVLPEYLSEWTTKKAEAEGVRSIASTEVEDFRYKDGRLSLILTGGQTVRLRPRYRNLHIFCSSSNFTKIV